MNMELFPDFVKLFKSLNSRGVEYVVVGGYALAHHGWPRYTKDMNVFLTANPTNARRVMAALDDFGFGTVALSESDFDKPRFFVRLDVAPVQVDLLTDVPGVDWQSVWRSRSLGTYGDQPVNYIDREHFIQAKRAAGRPEDMADLSKLGEL